MRQGAPLVVVGAVLLLLLGSTPASVHALSTDQYANLVIGEKNFTQFDGGTGQRSLSNPYDVAFDSSGDLWVADANNSRVLEYVPPFTDGMPASLVIGEAGYTGYNSILIQSPPPTSGDMSQPAGLAFDPSGNLWVADLLNSRVLEYRPPFTDGMSASVVIGQSNFTMGLEVATQRGLYNPFGLAFDKSGDLWVADYLNSRILEYTPPFTSGMPAALVIGQAGFTTDGTSTSQTALFDPTGLAFDKSGNLWVADAGNSRVLEYIPPFADGMPASLVIGQTSFASTLASDPQSRLYSPVSVAFDPSGNLWVSDTTNRVVEFSPPFTDGMHGSAVIGQPNLQSYISGIGQRPLHGVTGITFDPSGNLWVADTGNSRVLEYLGGATSTDGTDTKVAGGSASANQTSQTALAVSLSGSTASDGTAVNIFSADLSADPLAAPAAMTGAKFYDVGISGITDGTANLCVSNPSAGSSTVIDYYSSGAWVQATGITRTAGVQVCGSMPVSALSGTYLSAGDVQPPAPTLGLSLLLPVALVVVLVAALALVLRLRRGRRGPSAPPQSG